MKARYIFLFALIASVLLGCAQNIEPEQEQIVEDTPAIVAGEAIVLFAEDMLQVIEEDLNAGDVVTKSSDLNGLNEILGVTSIKRVFPHAG